MIVLQEWDDVHDCISFTNYVASETMLSDEANDNDCL